MRKVSDHSSSPVAPLPSLRPLGAWEQRLEEIMPLFGHRNWIVVADSAYPAQSRSGIETIAVDEGQQTIVSAVLKTLAASEHIRPIVHLDQELPHLLESDAPGVTKYREWLSESLHSMQFYAKPHEEIIALLDSAAAVFQVIIIKSNMRIPYTTVFFELDCAYWNAESESRLRASMCQ